MKKTLLMFLIQVIAFQTQSQSTWVRYFGSNSAFSCIVESYDRGYIICGETTIPGRNAQGWIVKTNINGDSLWSILIGDGAKFNNVWGIDQDNFGGLILTGASRELDNNGDLFIFKLNACGEKEWCNLYNQPGVMNYGRDIKALDDGSYLCYYRYYDLINLDSSFKRLRLIRVDANGNTLWDNYYYQDIGYEDQDGVQILLLSDSAFLISGEAYYESIPGSNQWWRHPFWVKVADNGDEIWELIWNEPGYIGGYWGRAVEDAYGDYYSASCIGGYERSSCFYKLSNNGEPLFYAQQLAPSSYPSYNRIINFFDDSTLFLGGLAYYTSDSSHKLVFKSDTAGNLLKADTLLPNLQYFYSSIHTHDDKILITGFGEFVPNTYWNAMLYKLNSDLEYDSIYTRPFTYDSLCPYPIVSKTIPIDCTILSEEEKPKPDRNDCSLRIFPNPASDMVRIELPSCYIRETSTKQYRLKTFVRSWDAATIDIYDLRGTRIQSHSLPRGQTYLETDVSSWAPGMYVVVCTIGGEAVVRGKVIVSEQ